ncbi:hypothetical protein Cch02nite_50200 [Catellatospora chokoriensis]|uniref:Uncharacterized protein n=2 Tax=Catellatospora chokoriensis TaxID=310353 RepID=A0A8J3K262_9ACTN|nr:hypothetical protein Cch02nite_50200 [Catellatospora chokoriensis]
MYAMRLFGDRVTMSRAMLVDDVMIDDEIRGSWFVTFERAVLIRAGETLWFDGDEPAIDRLDGTTFRPASTSGPYCWRWRLL